MSQVTEGNLQVRALGLFPPYNPSYKLNNIKLFVALWRKSTATHNYKIEGMQYVCLTSIDTDEDRQLFK